VVVVGTGTKGTEGLGGPGAKAQLNGPHHLVIAPDGALLIADTFNCRVLRYDPASGTVAGFLGTGTRGFAGDGGPALAAQTGEAYCLALDAKAGRLYLADLQNRRIRVLDLASGVVGTVAGNGKKGVPTDGAKASESPLSDPRAVAVGDDGRLWILERDGHCLRMVGTDGTIRTVAGTGQKGNGGDGDALTVAMNGPKHLWVERDGNVLIADTENHLVRRYLPKEGRLVRVVGTGKAGGNAPDAPLATALKRPHGVYLDASGAMLISDSENDRILRLAP
jgi:sugar lactone lactonase YvrE